MGILITVILGLIVVFFTQFVSKKTTNFEKVPLDVRQYIPDVKQTAGKYGLDWRDVLSVLWVESAGQKNAVGSSGEKGLMQLKQIAIDDLKLNYDDDFSEYKADYYTNIEAGTAFLALQKRRSGGNMDEAIRAYNQGFAGKDMDSTRSQLADEYLAKVKDKRRFL